MARWKHRTVHVVNCGANRSLRLSANNWAMSVQYGAGRQLVHCAQGLRLLALGPKFKARVLLVQLFAFCAQAMVQHEFVFFAVL